jgi:hypothetical protein
MSAHLWRQTRYISAIELGVLGAGGEGLPAADGPLQHPVDVAGLPARPVQRLEGLDERRRRDVEKSILMPSRTSSCWGLVVQPRFAL